jgi:predicted nucleic acid-binding protein
MPDLPLKYSMAKKTGAKVYIETTIPSYLIARPSRDWLIAEHQQITRDWWEFRGPQFDLFVSEPVLEEASAGDAILARKRLEVLSDIRVLALTEGILKLAQIPPKAAVDALHIAVATVYACEYLLTWNCRHIANAEIQRTARLEARKRNESERRNR